jgi:hypothetical protein
MNQSMIIALIGAAATITAALIGAYVALSKNRPAEAPDETSAGAPPKKLRGRIVVVAGLVLAAIVVLAGFGLGKLATTREVLAKHSKDVDRETQSYSRLVSQGIDAGKLYILPSVVMLISVERSADGEHINSDRRIVYGLQALAELDPSKNANAFIEGYHSDYAIQRVPGADMEREVEPNPDSKTWQVLFGAGDGDRHTLVTATHVVMPINLKLQHDVHMFKRLGPTEDAYCYPNFDGDIIEELVIIIQSDSLRLILPNDGDGDAEIQHADATIDNLRASLYTSSDNGAVLDSVVARFANLKKGDIAGLRFGWAGLAQ